MPWTDDYIGLPYKIDGRSREGVDCWGLVCLVYRERLGIELPGKDGCHTALERDLSSIAEAMEAEALLWDRVDKPKENDVVLMRRGPLACHVGICVGGGQMLHVTKGVNSSVEFYTKSRWEKRVVGFYRYAG